MSISLTYEKMYNGLFLCWMMHDNPKIFPQQCEKIFFIFLLEFQTFQNPVVRINFFICKRKSCLQV